MDIVIYKLWQDILLVHTTNSSIVLLVLVVDQYCLYLLYANVYYFNVKQRFVLYIIRVF